MVGSHSPSHAMQPDASKDKPRGTENTVLLVVVGDLPNGTIEIDSAHVAPAYDVQGKSTGIIDERLSAQLRREQGLTP